MLVRAIQHPAYSVSLRPRMRAQSSTLTSQLWWRIECRHHLCAFPQVDHPTVITLDKPRRTYRRALAGVADDRSPGTIVRRRGERRRIASPGPAVIKHHLATLLRANCSFLGRRESPVEAAGDLDPLFEHLELRPGLADRVDEGPSLLDFAFGPIASRSQAFATLGSDE